MTSKEKDKVLETYFSNLSSFAFDKAKDAIEKEKEPSKVLTGIWHSMVLLLIQLACSEKLYCSLSFLSSKGFLRKEVRKKFC